MRTLPRSTLLAFTVALALSLAPAVDAGHIVLDTCQDLEHGEHACGTATAAVDLLYHYAECYLFDEGPGNWLDCL